MFSSSKHAFSLNHQQIISLVAQIVYLLTKSIDFFSCKIEKKNHLCIELVSETEQKTNGSCHYSTVTLPSKMGSDRVFLGLGLDPWEIFFKHDFYFFHYSWFTVFCQFILYSTVKPGSLGRLWEIVHASVSVLIQTLTMVKIKNHRRQFSILNLSQLLSHPLF